MPVPQVDDPVLAVLLDRFDRMKTDFEKLREEVKDEIAGIRKDVSEVKSSQSKFDSILTKAQGGWLVIAGLGMLLMWALGFWEKLTKLWQ